MIIAVIPARYASTRFPGKLLSLLHGKPVLLHLLERSRQIRGIDRVLVATDDDRIARVVREAGGEVEMTASGHLSGSDRIGEVLGRLAPKPDFILNLQGDEPLLSPHAVEALVAALRREPESIWTLAEPIQDAEEFNRPQVVKVVCGRDGRALYFSRAAVPYLREFAGGRRSVSDGAPAGSLPLRHVGVYGYPVGLLEAFLASPATPLEKAEGLEQLRALELGMSIRVLVGAWPDSAVDTPEDLERLHKRYPKAEDLPAVSLESTGPDRNHGKRTESQDGTGTGTGTGDGNNGPRQGRGFRGLR